MSVASRRRNIFTTSSTSSGGSSGIQSIVAGTNISVDNTDPDNPIVSTTADDITVVANYSALPNPTTVSGQFYWCSASQGTQWLPGTLGGTYYNSGMYYSNGTSWEYINTPYQATQAEVNTGTNTDKFVTPDTFTNASKWSNYLTTSAASSTYTPLTRNITVNGTTQDLSADRTWTVTDANLSTTDVTTNNTSTSKHGFFPKLTSNSVYYVNNSGALTALTLGATGTVLTSAGATSAPTFSAIGITVGTTTIASGTSTRIGYNSSGVYTESANLIFDGTKFGVGGTPSNTVHFKTNNASPEVVQYIQNASTGNTFLDIDNSYGWNFRCGINTSVGPFVGSSNYAGFAFGISSSYVYPVVAGAATANTVKLGNSSYPFGISYFQRLVLGAGAAAAGSGPLLFTSGTNLTTAVSGNMEFNNTFHLTNSDATRRHVVLAPNTTKVTAGAPYTNDGYIVINIAGTDFKVMTTA